MILLYVNLNKFGQLAQKTPRLENSQIVLTRHNAVCLLRCT